MSWSSEQSCPCYSFLITDGTNETTQTINHKYSLKIKLKDSIDIFEFTKSITMESKISHILTNHAGVGAGSADTEISGFNTWDSVAEPAITWAQAAGFKGTDANVLSNVMILNGGELTTAKMTSSWTGTLNEELVVVSPTLDFHNITMDALHLNLNKKTLKANTSSISPMGWNLIAVDEGFKVMWFDDVGFREHIVEGNTTSTDIIKIKDKTISKTTTLPSGSSKYNVSSSVIGFIGDVVGWEPVYPINDPDSDGYELGFSHWMVQNVGASQWNWVRDIIDTVITLGTVYTGNIVVHLDINGIYQGSITSSRNLSEKDTTHQIYILSDKTNLKVYDYIDGSLIEKDVPKNMEVQSYPVMPL